MQLKYIRNILPPQDGAAKVCALCWAPNNTKFAVCTYDRVILLYDESGEKRDKFATKPVDSKYGKKSYIVKGLAFSPDSTRIAIAQTDNIVFVYKIGDEWGEKKTICNKFIQQSAVTCLIWPGEDIVFGTADGKVRAGSVKTNKSRTLFNTDSFVVSIAASPDGKGVLTGHADGSIVRYFLEEDPDRKDAMGKVCTHPTAPYALAWATNSFMVGGCDKRIFAYEKSGRIMQQFDYTREDEHEFTTAICSPSGQSVVMGSFDRLRVFNWSPRKGMWDEGKVKEIPNLYTITALHWKKDGSKLIAGSLCGSVELFDCCVKKAIYKNKFEMTYVGLSQVIVKNLANGNRVILKSFYGYEIDDVKIMGNDRFLVAHTSDTLILGDIEREVLSEVQWQGSSGNEKYYFDNEQVCMIFNAGELSLVQYGEHEVLVSVRTEFMNPHLISVRLNERKQFGVEDNKKLAYLIDLKTIAILDIASGLAIGQVNHDSKINWLELNETGHILLFRDSKLKLHLYNVDTQARSTILNYCSYVEWVPLSDVVVAQNRDHLCIWYSIDSPEKVTMQKIKGDIKELRRADGVTEVIVLEGVTEVSYTLEEKLIEFQTAMEDGDFGRGVAYLETLEMSVETESMWKTLSKNALEAHQLHIAERCFAALGDIAKARYLHETNKIAKEESQVMGGGDGYNSYKVRARMAIMEKNFNHAESIFLEQNYIDEAINMYQELHRWDDALRVAESRGHRELDLLRKNYFQWLMTTNQEGKAAEVKEEEGDHMAAINLYMKAGMPARAARTICSYQELMDNGELVQRVATALMKGEMFERAGELYEQIRKHEEALQCYRKGEAYTRAIELARHAFPAQVVKLEEEWGDVLMQQKQMEAAINHFIEAGAIVKACDAAIAARQWTKAIHILDAIRDNPKSKLYYKKIADHFANVGEYEKAEQFYVEAEAIKDCINMYNNAGRWEDAHRLASNSMNPEDVKLMYVKRGQELEAKGNYKEAERLYVTVNEPDTAISMYKRAKMYSDLIRMVKVYHRENVADVHKLVAEELETDKAYRQAEYHHVEAGNWKGAVNMYRAHDMWEEAYRVAKTHGDPASAQLVAYMWASSLGSDSAVKLLSKFGILSSAVDMAMERSDFDFAFELARVSMKNKLPEIHERKAMFLEDNGKYVEAEAEFIKAEKPKEAVLMYVHNRQWDEAQRVAEQHYPEAVSDVLIGQARVSFEDKDYQKAEAFLLRAQRPDLAITLYKNNGMWQDALRVCKEYTPNALEQLQDAYEQEQLSKTQKGLEALVRQAQEWESAGEHQRSVECYMRVNQEVTQDFNIMEKCWMKAARMAFKFLPQKATKVVQYIAPKLIEIKKYSTAAELYAECDMNREAIEALITGQEWSKAKALARDLEPRLEAYVDEQYRDFHRNQGNADALASVDVMGALDMYAERGEWHKCILTAEQQNPQLLPKYVALYAANLIKEDNAQGALDLYVKYGAPAVAQNYNIYRRIFVDVISMSNTNMKDAYQLWANLRDMLFSLCSNFATSPEKNSATHEEFENMLLIAHYYATRSAAIGQENLKVIATKLSVALLRHTDIIPADKAFYEAGIMCKASGWDNMAFVFLNRYLDLVEAIEENSLDALDNTLFLDTDIPVEIPLPDRPYLSGSKHEELKEWVLEVSMSQTVRAELPSDERGVYEASLITPSTGIQTPPCVVTGYPVVKNKVEFKNQGKVANKDDWNKFMTATKMTHSTECADVLKFVGTWCGGTPNPGYSL